MKRSSAANRGVWSGAQKWLTGSITMMAALLALAVNAKALGLSPWLGFLAPNLADHAASRIVLTPRSDTLRAIGEPAVITAAVLDARGAALAGATLKWKSSDTTIASVDSGGQILARAPGRATIEVSVRDIMGSASVLVRPVPEHVRIAGDSTRQLADGDTVQLQAHVLDARGHLVEGATPSWRSSNGAVAQVDSTGKLHSVAPGKAFISASIGDLRGDLRVEVVLTPASIGISSGDSQRALAGRALMAPVVLQVLTRAGQAVPGAKVVLATEEGEGKLTPDSAVSDAGGRVRTSWRLGAKAGQQRLFARVPGLDTMTVVLAEADPAPGNVKVELATPELRGMVRREMGTPVVARVTDTAGTALSFVRVSWSALDGGRVVGAVRTDSAGNVDALWTLGPKIGNQRLLVQVGNPRFTPATTIKALAEAGPPTKLAILAGNGQKAVVGKPLAIPILVQATDSGGNPVAGAAVIAKPSSGTLVDTMVTTDATGKATFRWTMGARPGAQKLDLLMTGTPLKATITATSRLGTPAKVSLTTRATGARGVLRVLATVVDEQGNPLPGAAIAFSATSGTFSSAQSKTDALGRTQVSWAPATARNAETRITARVAGTPALGVHVVPAQMSRSATSTRPNPRS